ncbi:MAG: pre-peptidase C-terminal domain-containing protein [Ardenticatenaceae bacterium]|nr:pre-peptidase C-terminal domain-containing protein [Ardenticatenaceae bacterium]
MFDSAAAAPLMQTPPEVQFTSASYSRNEGTNPNTATITVQLAGTMAASPATVEYIGVAGTATAGATNDYTIGGTGVLTFTTSPSTQTFTVTIVQDTVYEPDEFFTLVLRNPVNAVLGGINEATFTILNDDAAPTNTPTATSGAPPIYVDAYEPNNTLQEAYTTSSGTKLCSITLWPTGDLDYFRFVGKAGSYYIISTTDLEPGIDTALRVYNPQGTQIASNDDYEVGSRRSQVTITANSDGYYYARIENRDPSDPADKTYCFEVREIAPPTPTPSHTPPPLGSDDALCEFNSTIQYACTIGLDRTYNFNFVPVFGSLQDTDIFRIWMKPGIEYTCETTIPEGSLADTNMIFLDQNGNDFQPNLGNDDKALGDLGSKLSYLSNYTGWLHVELGPVNVPPFEEADQYTYQLICTATTATATPTAVPTSAFVGGGGVPSVPTATPIVFPTFPPTPTPIDLSSFNTPLPPTPPLVQFQPLPTSTPLSGGARTSTINVTIYYDQNENFMPELTEGIMDTAVSLYANSSGELVAFGYTNEAGMIRFDSISVVGAVRVVVPFLNYTQIVTGDSANILVRIAPQPLPVGIP